MRPRNRSARRATRALARVAAGAACVGAALSTRAGAQTAPGAADAAAVPRSVAEDCDYQSVLAPAPPSVPTAWRSFYPAEQLPLLDSLFAAGAWQDAQRTIRARYDAALSLADAEDGASATNASATNASATNASATNAPEARAFAALLDRVGARLDSTLGQQTVPTGQRALRTLSEFAATGPGLFSPPVRDQAVVFRAGTPEAIRVDARTPVGLRRAICYHAAVERRLLDRVTRPGRAAAAAFYASARDAWTAYLTRGYSQLPWELLVNNVIQRAGERLTPRPIQVVLAHPSVAVVVAGPNARELQRLDAVAVEPLGVLFYRGGFERYFGVSSAVTFTRTAGTGVGPFVHFGRVAKVGYIIPARRAAPDGTRRRDGVLLTVDLYRYLSDRPAQLASTLREVRRVADRVVP